AVHRLAAVASRWDELVAPQWTREKMKTTQFIDDFLAAKETWQGRCFEV
ncbi:MAG TPA: TIGR01212 family radical SAM protein, partial [Candidatus Lambdaproteobacteria bacterium]|nr:TIGR01212 family radical SAM protein [Candidatus Lambdaproteobacteria bacterium]